MNLAQLQIIFVDNGCGKIFAKNLSPNDNSKNQVYLGGSFEVLNLLPVSKINTEKAGEWERERFKASLDFAWITDTGKLSSAPNTQLILYPKYPEVRLSGFLSSCKDAPSGLMSERIADRLLFLGVSAKGQVLGYVTSPHSALKKEFENIKTLTEHGVFKVFELPGASNSKERLLNELYRIHESGWIKSKRLDGEGKLQPCEAPNCGGYTLEAELNIRPNGYSEPDFLGWEVKQFGVPSFERIQSATITLMTPEPTDGIYKTKGAEVFIRKYGYEDKTGRENRLNFGGIHKVGETHPSTHLEMKLIGYDIESGKIRNANGRISLVDKKDIEAASWSFSSMLLHWNRKHNQACYVPSLTILEKHRQYKYGNKIILGIGTDFIHFLKQMALGNIYYDPGIKMENVSTKPKIKKRSQFRIKSQHLSSLYKTSEVVDITL